MQGGAVKCWGGNGAGALGNGTTTNSNTAVTATSITGAYYFAASVIHTCGLFTGEGPKCWSPLGPANGQLPLPASLATGNAHTCWLVAGGEARCSGSNNQGQLGDGTNDFHLDPPAAVISVAGGGP